MNLISVVLKRIRKYKKRGRGNIKKDFIPLDESEIILKLFDNYRINKYSLKYNEQYLEQLAIWINRVREQFYADVKWYRSKQAVDRFLEIWGTIKELTEYIKVRKKKYLIKIDDVEELLNCNWSLYRWFSDVNIEFENEKMYREEITFCNELLQLFTLEEDVTDNFKCALGNAYYSLGMNKQADEWFASWLKKDSKNTNCLNDYLVFLLKINEIDKAEWIADIYFDDKQLCTIKNEYLFYQVSLVYRKVGKFEREKLLLSKLDELFILLVQNKELTE